MAEGIGTPIDVAVQEKQIRYRGELPKSPEVAERHEALLTLVDLGQLIPLTQIDSFHGRVKREAEAWTVNPSFANNGNVTGNANVNERSTLYTSDAKTAHDFAMARAVDTYLQAHRRELKEKIANYTPEERQSWLSRLNEEESRSPFRKEYTLSDLTEGSFGYHSLVFQETEALARRILAEESDSEDIRPEIQEIASHDPTAMVIDVKFKPDTLQAEDKKRYHASLNTLALPITEGSPVPFANRDDIRKFVAIADNMQRSVILSDDIQTIANTAGISEQLALQLASAYNARQMALRNPGFLADRLLRYPSDIYVEEMDANGTMLEVPMNLEYTERYMREAHIVAAKQPLDSATLGRDITSVSFFDLDKIGTRDQIASQKKEMLERMGGLMDAFPALAPNPPPKAQELLSTLEDAHTKPERLVQIAKKVGDFRSIYESDAGNWEGFSLEEHTETVLRNFDENFADILPVEYLAPMRLTMLVHDLGKPLAAARGEKHKQRDYNEFYAKSFLNEIGVDPKMRDLITAVITDGASLAFKAQQQPGSTAAQEQLRIFSEDAVKKFLGREHVDGSEVRAFTEMCKIFQLCDGGAYTSMAITRREGVGRFRNAPSFNDSFDAPRGLGKRDIRYKK